MEKFDFILEIVGSIKVTIEAEDLPEAIKKSWDTVEGKPDKNFIVKRIFSDEGVQLGGVTI